MKAPTDYLAAGYAPKVLAADVAAQARQAARDGKALDEACPYPFSTAAGRHFRLHHAHEALRAGPRRALYLSGPMTGLPDYNYPAFHSAAADLRAAGYVVINPAERDGAIALAWEENLRADIQLLVRLAGGLAMLPGWSESRGARLEGAIATGLGMPVLTVEQWPQAAALTDGGES